MVTIRRYALLLIVLGVGIFLGTFGWQAALIILTPLTMIWLMLWDEKSYNQKQYKRYMEEKQQYAYKNSR